MMKTKVSQNIIGDKMMWKYLDSHLFSICFFFFLFNLKVIVDYVGYKRPKFVLLLSKWTLNWIFIMMILLKLEY